VTKANFVPLCLCPYETDYLEGTKAQSDKGRKNKEKVRQVCQSGKKGGGFS